MIKQGEKPNLNNTVGKYNLNIHDIVIISFRYRISVLNELANALGTVSSLIPIYSISIQ